MNRKSIQNVVFMLISIVLVLFLYTGCPNGTDDPYDDGDDDYDFSWSDPEDLDVEGSSLKVSDETQLADKSRSRTIDIDAGDHRITPDGLYAAYSYIALIPDEVVLDMADHNFYGRGISSDSDYYQTGLDCMPWADEDLDEYFGDGVMSQFPGINTSHYPDAVVTEDSQVTFIGYVDDTRTPMDTDDVTAGAFVLFDGSADDTVQRFDLSQDSFSLTVDQMPTPGTTYTGIAYELVYLEAYFEDYGSVRMYFNDAPPYDTPPFIAGDLVVKENDQSDWKWIYLKHGDGPKDSSGTDITDGTTVPSVTPYTVAPNGYAQVWAPDDPAEGNSGNTDWNWHPYDGLYEFTDYFSSVSIPCFMASTEQGSWGGGQIPTNGDKRPSNPETSSMYLTIPGTMMNGWDQGNVQFLTPYICEADYVGTTFNYTGNGEPTKENNPGGYGAYDPDDDGNPIDSTPITLGDTTNTANIRGGVDNTGRTAEVNMIYHEQDYHLGPEDMSTFIYETSRLASDLIISRPNMTDNFGVYAYDSGLISNVYDDSPCKYQGKVEAGDFIEIPVAPTMFDMAKDRLCVLGNRWAPDNGPTPYSYNPPENEDDPYYFENKILEVQIELIMDVEMRMGEDCLGRSTDDVSEVTALEFDRRFLSFIPQTEGSDGDYMYWGDTDEMFPLQRGFYGQGTDNHRLETDIRFSLTKFEIVANNLTYYGIYSYEPSLYPDPNDGPFDGLPPQGVTFTQDTGITTKYYYTLDGSTPAVELDNDGIPEIKNTATHEWIEGNQSTYVTFDTTTTVTAVGFDEIIDYGINSDSGGLHTGVYRKASIPVSGTYTFTGPGNKLSGSISLAEPDETQVFVGLFNTETVSMNADISPVYSDFVTISSNTATYEIEDIAAGTYHLCVIADLDSSSSISSGDKAYPGISAEDNLLNTYEVLIDSNKSVNIDTWEAIP